MIPITVKAPDAIPGNKRHITPGKRYTADAVPDGDGNLVAAYIATDTGLSGYITLPPQGCRWIGGEQWEIVEE